MFIFNYSNEDLTVAIRGHVQTLRKNELSYVDENWVSLKELKNMFGNYKDTAGAAENAVKWYQNLILFT